MSERRQRIMEEWNVFREMVVPKDAPETQLREMRRSFFAGASMCFTLLVNKTETEDLGMALMDDLDSEFRNFAERTKTGAV
jgi:hypothetical protein